MKKLRINSYQEYTLTVFVRNILNSLKSIGKGGIYDLKGHKFYHIDLKYPEHSYPNEEDKKHLLVSVENNFLLVRKPASEIKGKYKKTKANKLLLSTLKLHISK